MNPLLSLADPAVYAIPMLLLIGWRGEPGVKDEPQHVTQGRVQERLLQSIEVPYQIVGAETADIDDVISGIASSLRNDARPSALLIRKGTFADYRLDGSGSRLPLTRATAIEHFLDSLDAEAVLVSTTGMASREVFDYRERHGQPHDTGLPHRRVDGSRIADRAGDRAAATGPGGVVPRR